MTAAVLQFRDFYVIESAYRSNPFIKENSENLNITPKIFYKLETNPDVIEESIVYLGIELGDPSLKNHNFYVKVKIAGFFEIFEKPEDMTEEDVLGFYKYNAVAILFPYLRSIVSDVTSKGNESPIILPTMNIVAMIDENMFTNQPDEFE